MEFKIKMKENVSEEIQTLMENIKDLNEGEEIGGWLLGDWDFKEDTAILTLDEFIIPNQEVSHGEVNIDPNSMTDMLKEFGSEKCNRIKAHWHIHPFGKGTTNWSSIDEEKINDFMQPEKGREIFVFLLSSEDSIKARIELNTKISLLGHVFNTKKSYDNLDVEVENLVNLSVYNKLKDRIGLKVSRIKNKVVDFDDYKSDYWREINGYIEKQTTTEKENLFHIKRFHDKLVLITDKNLGYFLLNSDLDNISSYTDIECKENKYIFTYRVSKKQGKKLEQYLKDALEDLSHDFEAQESYNDSYDLRKYMF